MEYELIGNGWRFPVLPDESGALNYITGDANVEQSLRILLLTALGERLMREGLGSRAPRLVFAPGSVQYLRLLETTVREAVRDWEPRVNLEIVRAETDPRAVTDPSFEVRVIVSIQYRVRRTNTRNNLVFPFYLGTTEQL